MENLNTAFDVAEKYLDIPRMLDPDGKFHNFLTQSSYYLIIFNFFLNGGLTFGRILNIYTFLFIFSFSIKIHSFF